MPERFAADSLWLSKKKEVEYQMNQNHLLHLNNFYGSDLTFNIGVLDTPHIAYSSETSNKRKIKTNSDHLVSEYFHRKGSDLTANNDSPSALLNTYARVKQITNPFA
jgi:hypothetical protein